MDLHVLSLLQDSFMALVLSENLKCTVYINLSILSAVQSRSEV